MVALALAQTVTQMEEGEEQEDWLDREENPTSATITPPPPPPPPPGDLDAVVYVGRKDTQRELVHIEKASKGCLSIDVV